ncbi:molybdopterin biosynthesis protein MoaC [Ameyamaea chiangmaiensis NBRC 103196]|uniref:Cyclic pyranopterin monophosphate synthase n=2 Tax=Ameyamaea chiangmaiensis TaxID=442969 RepID=A0A850P586_9PROT|nr:cyclic pyranopterin monophosphate synthase MoaC [Ameyamaea chiangmaiensis]NVN39805.1 cyclic pyranopterin monophosphate synthase MoaC [Ameyamaea chiangmaiensis]GBQ68755.1 molybdopterin biosynthesis protein MoaC [Ameyamaea chiangmaiensis NBRC 103196]
MAEGLTHIGPDGSAIMVDVSDKPETRRDAVAVGAIRMRPETVARIVQGTMPKGDVLATARIAGIMAAKRTADLIPLCHPLSLSSVQIDLSPGEEGIAITARVRTTGRTGVEMEALTAVSVAGLTLYDMCKAVDREMVMDGIRLALKTGGQSGDYGAGQSKDAG